MSLKVNIAGVDFKNPVIAASGTFGFGEEFSNYIDINKLGGISSKGLTLKKNPGNPGIRIYETPAGIMNSIGLQNPGVDHFIENELIFMRKYQPVVIANLGGHSYDDYRIGASKLEDSDVDMIELNISCPNLKEGGMAFGTDPHKAKEVIKQVRKATKKPLIVKLSPNVTSIGEFAKIAEGEGADSISLVNTFNAMAVDIKRKKFVFNNKTAGLSGPAIKPIALRMTYEVVNAVKLPVIAMGGIMNVEDALEFLMVGAKAIQVGTANFKRLETMIDIVDGLEKYLEDNKISDINEIIGIL
ncbi:dihydroorotate dehydrogenase [Anaerococcus sp. NML200574]|uniref:dihydroorotate dehydrogenase n=1 Tax=unclassified Anaerococcus TaxID=2614126 RepID=UPI000D0B6059|nr:MULTISPECIES: dihydroorotate dehydrogenase [unclassified Anaerococcus]MCW6677974.1 dihydroorotate dehydrogenase [Anaerococcus sp. NML200574]